MLIKTIPTEGGIYIIKNIKNNKIYVGSSINLYKRAKQHLNLLRKKVHHSTPLQRAWNKYGEPFFIFEILELITNSASLIEREQYYINHYNSYIKGYNICAKAGSTLGFKHSNKTKELMSLNHLGIKKGPCSFETKSKISITKSASSSSKEGATKRKNTLYKLGNNIFKIIGSKSSVTQKINGLNKGINNPNSNNSKILIFNNLDELVYISNNSTFEVFCDKNNLPKRVLIKSRASDGVYKLYSRQSPRNKEFSKFKGWYCRYE